MSVIGRLVSILVIVLILGLVYWILQQLPLPEPFGMIVKVVIGLIAVVFLLSLLFGGVNIPTLRIN